MLPVAWPVAQRNVRRRIPATHDVLPAIPLPLRFIAVPSPVTKKERRTKPPRPLRGHTAIPSSKLEGARPQCRLSRRALSRFRFSRLPMFDGLSATPPTHIGRYTSRAAQAIGKAPEHNQGVQHRTCGPFLGLKGQSIIARAEGPGTRRRRNPEAPTGRATNAAASSPRWGFGTSPVAYQGLRPWLL